MTCYSPTLGYVGKALTANGKRQTVFNPRDALGTEPQFHRKGRCNYCIGCRIDYTRGWSVRCMHEASLWLPQNGFQGNSFITLTYNKESLPKNGSLDYDHWTRFMKRLRERFARGVTFDDGFQTHHIVNKHIRFYMGPEYGDVHKRPHYHALLFNCSFPDQYKIQQRGDYALYRSPFLDSIWSDPVTGSPYGYATVGSVTTLSAAYVARYMLKKVKGEDHHNRYFTQMDLNTGEIIPILPEKARMSNRNGIGKDWFDKWHKTDCYNGDFVVLNGKKYPPPKYYDNLLAKLDPGAYDEIKALRVRDAKENSDNSTFERLEVREFIQHDKISKMNRGKSF